MAPDRPDRVGVYESFFEQLSTIMAVAEDVPLKFLLIPSVFQLEDQLWNRIEQNRNFALQRDQPQKLIVEWLQSRSIPHLDLLPLFLSSPPFEDGQRHLYHLQDIHLNARGNRLSGKGLADLLGGNIEGKETGSP